MSFQIPKPTNQNRLASSVASQAARSRVLASKIDSEAAQAANRRFLGLWRVPTVGDVASLPARPLATPRTPRHPAGRRGVFVRRGGWIARGDFDWQHTRLVALMRSYAS